MPTVANPPASSSPTDIDIAIAKLTAYRNVVGFVVVSRPSREDAKYAVIRSGGQEFEGTTGESKMRAVVRLVKTSVSDLNARMGEIENVQDSTMSFIRLRSDRSEVLIVPSTEFVLAVLHVSTVV
ncbi:hypothetical protein K437DRAFT_1284 [Tilletiaria anomala UBC 951]|uniref:Roadblock/LAMTOR2 domain-containing protein n=1 Tax=Tilletiaria anomala (strain ATCC 24038 / CBS 436.72 / UBC 951) TaxID=1037660 RepID=A0A066WS84_TILAU|nr:uncharacterized protein K437DRAFT_1284 [Tilletiaria anomala UBC 951]KDN53550.1 hypothetical protein K437DRAFT_1284 [Tilletiaria anomala UBC 951]